MDRIKLVYGAKMDVHYFAIYRLGFIKSFYETALAPFQNQKWLIENELPPFEPSSEPSFCDSEEPQFTQKWIEVDNCIDVLGIQSASLLCSTIKLYLDECLRQASTNDTRRIATLSDRKPDFKSNWLQGYCVRLETELNLRCSLSGVNFKLLEELILLRNRGQHPEFITTISTRYSTKDMQKISLPF